MLDSIISLVKNQLSDVVNNNTEVPANKSEQVVETATNSIVDTLKNSFKSGNLSSLTNMLSSSNSLSANTGLSKNLENSVVSALADKVGLSKNVAGNIASVAIPAILNAFQNKINTPGESGFSIESLIETFSGNGKSSGGLLGKLLGFFGK